MNAWSVRGARVIGLLGLVLLAHPSAFPQKAPLPPRLVVFVSVDQMRFDYLTRFGSLFEGGFRTLLTEGAVFVDAAYRHASTETGPGHAVLLSGRNGSHSGIVANEWYDTVTNEYVNVVDDPAHAPLGGVGRGASPANFIGFTVGDVLKRASPGSRVVAVSLKDRSAVLMGGRRADAAYWYEPRAGRFTSSTYYMASLPRWLAAWNEERGADRLFGRKWTRLLPGTPLYDRLAGDDAAPGEHDGVDNVFPHAIRGRPPEAAFYDDLRRTPFADEMTLEVALRALDAHALGRRASTDFLLVGFSAADVIGHTYGPDSHEVMDNLLRLDRTLQRLFDAVDVRVGLPRRLVVLSADHGARPLVEVLQRRGLPGRRVRPEVFNAAVDKALQARFPGATALLAFSDTPHYYLDLASIRAQGLDRRAVEQAVEEGLMSTGLVERVYTHAELLDDPPADDGEFTLFQSSFFEPRSPHLISRLKEHVDVSIRPGGTGHGTPQPHDRHVPLIFMGTQVKPGRYAEPCGPEDIAPTLARLLGLDYPMQDAKRVLTEMIR